MLMKGIVSSETAQVFARCHIVRPDEAWTQGYVMPVVFQWARDSTMAPTPAQLSRQHGGMLGREALRLLAAVSRRLAPPRDGGPLSASRS
jgi:hypothetical protein